MHKASVAPRLIQTAPRRARDTALVAIGLLALSLLGAAQSLLLIFLVGEGPDTDAVLAAYAVYVPFALFGVTLRRTLVPVYGALDSDRALAERGAEATARVTIMAGFAAALLLVFAPSLAAAVAPGLAADARGTATTALLLLIPAGFLQVCVGSMSATLGAARRLPWSIGLSVGASTVAVISGASLLLIIGVLGLAVGVLCGAVLLTFAHVASLWYLGVRPRLRLRWAVDAHQRRLGLLIVAGAALAVVQQLGLTFAVAAVSDIHLGVTLYSYAFFIAAIFLNMTSLSLTFIALPDLVRDVAERGLEAAAKRVVALFPILLAVLVPMLVALGALGEPILQAFFGPALGAESIRTMYELATILTAWVLFAAISVLGATVLLVLQRWRLALVVAGLQLAVQAVAILVAAPNGLRAVAVAHVVGTAVGTLVLFLAVFRGRAWSVLGLGLAHGSPAFALSSLFVVAWFLVGDDAPVLLALLALLVATAAYAATVALLWRRGSDPFRLLVRQVRSYRGGASADGGARGATL